MAIFLSVDNGDTFNQVDADTNFYPKGASFGETVVLVGSGGQPFTVSNDSGLTWTPGSLAALGESWAIANERTIQFYPEIGLWIGLCVNGNRIVFSPDGSNYSVLNFAGMAVNNPISQAFFNNNIYMFADTDKLFILKLDGTFIDLSANLWARTEPASIIFSNMIVYKGRLYLIFSNGTIVYTSDGVNFHPCNTPILDRFGFSTVGVFPPPFIFDSNLYLWVEWEDELGTDSFHGFFKTLDG